MEEFVAITVQVHRPALWAGSGEGLLGNVQQARVLPSSRMSEGAAPPIWGCQCGGATYMTAGQQCSVVVETEGEHADSMLGMAIKPP